jgi:GT2 family glycosyltransferase
VPLYGRADFVEHQLVEFAKDEWLTKHVQIIYVLDDPKLVEPFYMQAEALHRLYQIPFMWVWGAVNRGFSGANNLGAQFAKGEHLVFLNSDAFPDAPGWVEALQHTLYVHPKVGAVGPNLVFATGGIQHAGMQFLRRDELGIWINHHPHMGLDPILDPHKSLTTVPGITGACLAMRRTDFDAVGGWEQGYLIGDFEDSDLCFKLRSKGFDIAYDPSVRLTHLERQSFKLLGQDEFRTRVVIYNAVRHQNRWGQLLSESSTL